MNTITRKINSINTSISNKAAERLSEYVPRGCPFKNYTLLDLLKDLVNMYGFRLEWKQTMTITEFIRYLMGIEEVHAKVYGEAIIQIIEEEWMMFNEYHVSKPVKRAVWKNHEIIGYVTISRNDADFLNKTQNSIYFGFTEQESELLDNGSEAELIESGFTE